MDRFEIDLLLQEWTSIEEQISSVETKIVERASRTEKGKILNSIQILMTAPGVGHYTGLGLLPECDDLETRIREPRDAKPFWARNLRIPILKRSNRTRKRLSLPMNSYWLAGSDFSGSASSVE